MGLSYVIVSGLTTIVGVAQYDLFINGEFEGFYDSELAATQALLTYNLSEIVK